MNIISGNSALTPAAATPHLPQQRQARCCTSRTTKKVAAVGGIALLGMATTGVCGWLAFKTNSCLSGEGKDCAVIYTFDALIALSLACVSYTSILVCRAYRNLQGDYPQYSHHQGELFETVDHYKKIHVLQDNEVFFKEFLEKCFHSLEKQGLLETWLKIKGYADLKAAVIPLREYMSRGKCFGYTMGLLNLMGSHYNTPSKEIYELLEKKREQIYFYQFWHHILADYFKCEDQNVKSLIEKHSDEYIKEIIVKKEPVQIYAPASKTVLPTSLNLYQMEFIFMKWMEECKALDINLSRTFFFRGNWISRSSSPRELEDCFLTTLQNLLTAIRTRQVVCFNPASNRENSVDLKQYTLTGTVTLAKVDDEKTKKEQQEKETGTDISGHIIFLQLSDRYRFHDSGISNLPGFFEFPSQDLLFKGLAHQLELWKDFNQISLRLYLIPKTNDHAISIRD